MRIVISALVVLVAACGSPGHGDDAIFQCVLDDAGVPGVICACYDGFSNCNTECPVDLSAPCTPGATCGDVRGGSNGDGNCNCTCDNTGQYVCGPADDSCVPER